MLKGELRRQAILDTAEELFFEKGYVGATIQDFLDRLECSKGSFYHHFDSKLQVLMELCRQKAGQNYKYYQIREHSDALAQLNDLIYCAMPFRDGEDKTIALLLPLVGLSDGKMVMDAILDAQREQFFPEVSRLLTILQSQKMIHFHQPLLPALLWDGYTACYRRLMEEAARIGQGGGTGGVLQIIEAERFLWERLLDAPFGSMELVRGDEALRAIGHAVTRIRRLESGSTIV